MGIESRHGKWRAGKFIVQPIYRSQCHWLSKCRQGNTVLTRALRASTTYDFLQLFEVFMRWINAGKSVHSGLDLWHDFGREALCCAYNSSLMVNATEPVAMGEMFVWPELEEGVIHCKTGGLCSLNKKVPPSCMN